MACDRSPGEGVAPLNKGLSRSDWGLRWEGPSGPHRSDSEVSGRKQSSAGAGVAKRSRMPHGGRHRKVTGGRQIPVINDKILIFRIILLNININSSI